MDWISQRIDELDKLNTKFDAEFGDLAIARMDVKIDPNVWSINECLDHLIQTNQRYHGILDEVAAGSYNSRKWVHRLLIPYWLGKIVVKVVSPGYQRKTKTARIFYPSASNYGKNMTSDLLTANQLLAEKFKRCPESELDTLIVTSPVASFVTYSLRDCLNLLVAHEQRHFAQALRLKSTVTQPSSVS